MYLTDTSLELHVNWWKEDSSRMMWAGTQAVSRQVFAPEKRSEA